MKQLSLSSFVKSNRRNTAEEDDAHLKRTCLEESNSISRRTSSRTEFQITECYKGFSHSKFLLRPCSKLAKKTRIVLSEPYALNSFVPSATQKHILTDVQFDIRSEFAVTVDQSKLQLFSPNEWMRNGDSSAEPILQLDTNVIRQRFQNNNLSFGFSSAQFLGNSLNLLCSFSRQHQVEVFDLEMVDESTCAPINSFDLSAAVKNSTLSPETPFATCVTAVSERVGLAALSNGLLANLDARQGSPSLFTKMRGAPFVLGQNNLSKSENATLTALSIYSDQIVLTGAKNGTVCVWDRRKTSEFISTCAMKSTVGSIVPYAPPYVNGNPLIWMNDFSGELAAMRLEAHGLEKVAHVQTNDGKRRANCQAIPTPKISILEPEGALLLPHISTSSLYYYDASTLETSTSTSNAEETTEATTVKLLHAHQFEENDICAGFFNSTYRLLFVGDAHGRRAYHHLDF